MVLHRHQDAITLHPLTTGAKISLAHTPLQRQLKRTVASQTRIPTFTTPPTTIDAQRPTPHRDSVSPTHQASQPTSTPQHLVEMQLQTASIAPSHIQPQSIPANTAIHADSINPKDDKQLTTPADDVCLDLQTQSSHAAHLTEDKSQACTLLQVDLQNSPCLPSTSSGSAIAHSTAGARPDTLSSQAPSILHLLSPAGPSDQISGPSGTSGNAHSSRRYKVNTIRKTKSVNPNNSSTSTNGTGSRPYGVHRNRHLTLRPPYPTPSLLGDGPTWPLLPNKAFDHAAFGHHFDASNMSPPLLHMSSTSEPTETSAPLQCKISNALPSTRLLEELRPALKYRKDASLSLQKSQPPFRPLAYRGRPPPSMKRRQANAPPIVVPPRPEPILLNTSTTTPCTTTWAPNCLSQNLPPFHQIPAMAPHRLRQPAPLSPIALLQPQLTHPVLQPLTSQARPTTNTFHPQQMSSIALSLVLQLLPLIQHLA